MNETVVKPKKIHDHSCISLHTANGGSGNKFCLRFKTKDFICSLSLPFAGIIEAFQDTHRKYAEPNSTRYATLFTV